MIANRRRFLLGAGAALIAAPSIVRAASLMPVSVIAADRPLTAAEAKRLQAIWLRHVEKIIYPVVVAAHLDLLAFGSSLIEIGAAPRVVPFSEWKEVLQPMVGNIYLPD